MKNKPDLIYFPKAGSREIGYISIAELSHLLPFDIKRVFWTYHTPTNVIRGKHAHKETEIVLIAAVGKVEVTTEDAKGNKEIFVLDDPSIGLYLPPSIWHTMIYSDGALQIALASTSYTESDYLRSKEDFLEYWAS